MVCGDPRRQEQIGLAGLAPKGCFISAEAVEREVGQIGETQKATRELVGSTLGSTDFGTELDTASVPFVTPCDGSRSKLAETARPSSAIVGPLGKIRVKLAEAMPETHSDGRPEIRTAQFPIVVARRSRRTELGQWPPLHCGLSIVIRNDGRFERFVIFGANRSTSSRSTAD